MYPAMIARRNKQQTHLSRVLKSAVPHSMATLLVHNSGPAMIFLLFRKPLSKDSPFLRYKDVAEFCQSVHYSPNRTRQHTIVPYAPTKSYQSPSDCFSSLPKHPP